MSFDSASERNLRPRSQISLETDDYPALPPPGDNPGTRKLINVLQTMKDEGFVSVSGFLKEFLTSEDESIKRRVSYFFNRGGFESILGMMLQHKRFNLNPSRKRDSRYSTLDISGSSIMGILVDSVLRMLNYELEELSSHESSRKAPSDMKPEDAKEFSFQALGKHYADIAPVSHRVFSILCRAAPLRASDSEEQLEDLVPEELEPSERDGYSSGDSACGEPTNSEPKKKKRAIRDKEIIVTSVMATILFSRTRNANAYQTMLGYYLFAAKTSRRAIAVLNHLGFSVAYDTVCNALKSNAKAVQGQVIHRASSGDPLLVTYDNVNALKRVREERDYNHNHFVSFTAAAVVFLRIRKEIKERLRDFSERIEVGPDSNPASERDHAPLPGLDREFFLRVPDYSSMNAEHLLSTDSITQYWPDMVRAHIHDILSKFFSSTASMKNRKYQRFFMPHYHQALVQASDVQTLATMELDEATIDGNIEILNEISQKQLGLDLEALKGRFLPISGDQLTSSRIRSAKQLRRRDREENRFLWAEDLPGWLHVRMAVAHMIFGGHIGRQDARDPASLTTLIKLLGRTRCAETIPDLGACHELLMQTLEAHVLGAAASIVGAASYAELADKFRQKDFDWTVVADQLVDKFFPLRKVAFIRQAAERNGKAKFTADTAAQERKRRLQALPKNDRSARKQLKMEMREELNAEINKSRDIVFENALLLMQHAMVYRDFHTAIRSGSSGRIEKDLEILTVMFNGSKLHNYAQEMVDFQVRKKMTWTEEYRDVWLDNTLVNLAGRPDKFIAIDEFNEYVVEEVKNAYNAKGKPFPNIGGPLYIDRVASTPSGNFESTQFLLEVISRNIVSFRHIKKSVIRSSGAPDGGSKHSRLNDQGEVREILTLLLKGNVLTFQPGRVTVGSHEAPVKIKESTDFIELGKRKLGAGRYLAEFMARKLKRSGSKRTRVDESDEEGGDSDGDLDAELDAELAAEEAERLDQEMEFTAFGHENVVFQRDMVEEGDIDIEY